MASRSPAAFYPGISNGVSGSAGNWHNMPTPVNGSNLTPSNGHLPRPSNLPMYSQQPALSLTADRNSNGPNNTAFFLSSDLRAEVLQRSIEMNCHAPEFSKSSHQAAAMANPLQSSLPTEVLHYRFLTPLEGGNNPAPVKSCVFGYTTSCFTAIDSRTGAKVVLRRIHNYRPPTNKCIFFIEAWKKIHHPNIVRLKEVFTCKAFGDNSLLFVSEFVPSCATLSQHILAINAGGGGRSKGGGGRGGGLFPETLIWNYIVQLTAAMRSIHMSGLAARGSIDVTKILIDSRNRLLLSGCCVLDVLLCETMQMNMRNEMLAYQQEDMKNLGKVTMALACSSVLALLPENFKSSYDLIHSSQFSEDLRNLITYLFSNNMRTRNLNEIMPMIGARFYTQFEAVELRADQLESELVREAENARLLRLLCKLSAINERPEFNLDMSWSETGDRYLLKLFRDYVFHQVTEDGRPWMDMSHVVSCLNKVDCGSEEKVCLTSRDGHNALVVTFSDLKQCLDSTYHELCIAAPPTIQSQLSMPVGAMGAKEFRPAAAAAAVDFQHQQSIMTSQPSLMTSANQHLMGSQPGRRQQLDPSAPVFNGSGGDTSLS